MKKLLRNPWFRISAASQILVIIVLISALFYHMKHTVLYSPPLEFWSSRMLTYDNGWHMDWQYYSESGYPHAEDTEIIYGPFISVPKGDYTLRINYQCDAKQTFRVYAFEQEDRIKAQEPEILLPNKQKGNYHYILNDDVEQLEIRVCSNGLGNVDIYDITFASGYWEQTQDLLAFLILFVLSDILFAFLLLSGTESVKNALLALFLTLSVHVNPAYVEDPDRFFQFVHMFFSSPLSYPLVFVAAYFFFGKIRTITHPVLSTTRGKVCSAIPAFLFCQFLLFGYSYQETDSWDLVFAHHFQAEKAYIAAIGLFLLLYYFTAGLYVLYERSFSYTANGLIARYLGLVRRKPFLTTFLTLLIINLPYMITAYPGISTGDTADQVLQAYQIPVGSAESVRLLSDHMMINQHFSVVHTMLMHVFLEFGIHVFHSANIGLGLSVILQALATLAAVAYLVKTICEEHPSDLLLLLLIVTFAFLPRFQSYLFVLTKDVLYSAILLTSLILLWKLLKGRRSVPLICAYLGTLLGMTLLRNDAIYIILLQLIVFLIVGRKNHGTQKIWLIAVVCTLGVHLLFARVILPLNDISPSTVNEALSIPAQQTARYLRDHPDDVREDEKTAIDTVWNYSKLAIAENYNPVRSDLSKGTYRLTSDSKDLLNYLKAWFSMFLRHPDVYIQAFLNNYYEYFYPGSALADNYSFEHADETFEYINARCEENGVEGMHLKWPECFDQQRLIIEKIRESAFSLPFLSVFLSVACYTWVLLLLLFHALYKRDRSSVLLLMPLFFVLLVCFAGPCNGNYFRYFYPITVCLPAVVFLTKASD